MAYVEVANTYKKTIERHPCHAFYVLYFQIFLLTEQGYLKYLVIQFWKCINERSSAKHKVTEKASRETQSNEKMSAPRLNVLQYSLQYDRLYKKTRPTLEK